MFAPQIRNILSVALACSAASALALLFAAVHSNSSAFLAATVASLVATASHVLLLHGLKTPGSADGKGATSRPSRDLYFWAFIVAMQLFSLGAGLAIYEGTGALARSHLIEGGRTAYVLGGIALMLTGWSLQRSLAGAPARNDPLSLSPSDDPGLFALILQCMAALAAVVLAIAGLFAETQLEMTGADGLMAVAIGLSLATVAAVLAIETKKILADAASGETTHFSAHGERDAALTGAGEAVPFPLTMIDAGVRALSAAMARVRSTGVAVIAASEKSEKDHADDSSGRP